MGGRHSKQGKPQDQNYSVAAALARGVLRGASSQLQQGSYVKATVDSPGAGSRCFRQMHPG